MNIIPTPLPEKKYLDMRIPQALGVSKLYIFLIMKYIGATLCLKIHLKYTRYGAGTSA